MPNLFQYNGKKWIEIAKNGEDGHSPIPGVDFDIPKNGKDGSSDKPKDIKSKLESLDGEDRLDASAIKNLDKFLKGPRLAKDGYPYGLPQPAAAITYQLNNALVGRANTLNLVGPGITFSSNGDVGTYDLSGISGGSTPTSLPFGIPVTNGGTPKEFLYIDNAGNVFGDLGATRDSVTHLTQIAKTVTGLSSVQLLLGDPGIGADAALINFSDQGIVGGAGFIVATDAGNLGGSPGSGAVYLQTDNGANLAASFLAQADGANITVDDSNSSEKASLNAGIGTGIDFGYRDPTGLVDNQFFASASGIGWKNRFTGYNFFLPSVDGGAGDVYTTDGAGNGSFQPVSSGLTLQTDGTPNGSQTLLNLTSGTGITLTDDGIGGITFDFTGSSSGVALGGPQTGFTPKEIQYIDNGGLQFGDTNFIRDSVTNETSILSIGGITTGYTSGFSMTAGGGGSVALTHENLGTGVGGQLLFQPLASTLIVQDTPNNVAAGWQANLNTGQVGFDYLNGAANRGIEIGGLDGSAAFLKYTYNLGGNLGNVFGVTATSLQLNSDLVTPGSSYLRIVPLNGTAYLGDISGANNFMQVGVDDNNQIAEMGALNGGGNQTVIRVFDASQVISAFTNVAGTQLLFHTGLPANGKFTSFGYQAGNSSISGTGDSMFGAGSGFNLSSGLRNSFFGDDSGTAVATTNDNSYFGNGAGSGTVRTTNARNTGVGRLAGVNPGNGDSDNSFLGYNTQATGHSSSIVIGSGAAANASNQAIIGGNSAYINDMVIGAGIVSATPPGLTMRLTDGAGTNVQSGGWQYSTGDSTGNKGGGPHVFFVAPEGGTPGSGVNSALSNEVIRFNPSDVFVSKRLLSNVASLTAANDLVAGDSNQSSVTGNTTINGLDARWIAAQYISFIFQGTPLLKSNTTPSSQYRQMILQGSVDFQVPSGTTMVFAYDPVTDSFREVSRTIPDAYSGVNTPAATNVTNITASTPNNSTFTRVGNFVTCYGTITVTNTLAVASQVDVSLPIASNLGGAQDLNGVATMDSTASVNMYIKGDATNNRASIFFTAAGVGQTSVIYYSYQYILI